MKTNKSMEYSSPQCETFHLIVESAILVGSYKENSLGSLDDKVAGEDFIY